MSLTIKPRESCAFDQISLGEVMLRLDPGEGRIRTARNFQVWEGGGEYNTSRGLRKCFGYKTAVVTAFVDNEVALVRDVCGFEAALVLGASLRAYRIEHDERWAARPLLARPPDRR